MFYTSDEHRKVAQRLDVIEEFAVNRRFLILFVPSGGHTCLDIVPGVSLREALCRYIEARDESVQCLDDESIRHETARGRFEVSHPLALIESEYKPYGEWQVRELPESSWNSQTSETIFVGEDPSDVAVHLRRARTELRREFPRSQLRGFIWYLQEGVLVTFYRRVGRSSIQVVRRYLHTPGIGIEPWAGDCDELLEALWLGRS